MLTAQLDITVWREATYQNLVREALLQTRREIRMFQIASLVVLDIIVIQMLL